MKSKLHLILILFLNFISTFIRAQDDLVLPSAAQLAWQKAEFGAVFHYDLHVFDGLKYGQENNRIATFPNYNLFNPEKLNTDQWVKAAKEAGATFALLTVTHETGFALYQSQVNPYCLKAVNWRDGKGDIVQDFVNSCKKYGIKPGLYLGIRWNSFLGVHDFKVEGKDPVFSKNRQEYYNKMVEGMVTELCSNYGPLFEIWFDGGASSPELGAPNVLPIIQKLQPNAVFYWNAQRADVRWGGSETGTVSYPCWSTFTYKSTFGTDFPKIYENNAFLLKHGDNDGKYWMPAMSDAPLRGFDGRHEWFWEPNDDSHIEPLERLLNMYYKSVGRNSTLILGLTPDPTGLIPAPDVQSLKEFGDEIKTRFQHPIFMTKGQGKITLMKLNTSQTINHLVFGEDLSQGERIQSYLFWVKNKGQWKKVCEGISVGHKRIQFFDPIQGKEFKLEITKSKGNPNITEIQLFNIKNINLKSYATN